ncbi:MAG TPA: hypothetical protein PKY82_17410 [Pyrinomonadaceae bacterium]|nr:hypothetical protein [Pyrinomonadaceae bacterium]
MSKKLQEEVRKLDEEICRDAFINSKSFLQKLKAEQKLGILHDDRPICSFLRPHFLARSHYQKIVRAAEVLSQAFEKLAKAALENRTILNELGLTEKEEKMARIEPGYQSLCVSSRLDAFWNGDDFKFLEYNAESPAGIADQMQLEKSVELAPPVQKFLVENKHWKPKPHVQMLAALLQAYREFGGQKANPGIAIVDWKDVSTVSEFYVLQEYFESQGYPTVVADPRELDYDGQKLRTGDFEIDIFYKRIIIHEFLENFDETHPLTRAYTDGKVCMANSFRSKLAHKKAGFSILSDNQYSSLFNSEELKMIDRHIPWTRNLSDCRTTFEENEIDLLELLRRNRERFLLKPNDDYGGKGIKLGWETNESEWESALNDALGHSYIVQERVLVGKTTIPTLLEKITMPELLVDFDPFVFNGKVEGGLVRLSSQSLVNVTQGGGETALVIIEDF